eukprot:CAMPEP_0115727248 /NCGR_PEP_ID=MMETSP0272-20121206/82322_1 /TAXON_ID=71861 /ORGANISM="Scrippsiella trochoidea, Strain CCMP3099" /LENGTH=387 /DNA_ID=CAMNT_0003170749 /DNA_START=24 /DNA_END=1186 /DNA_ORIENTATION=-
MLSSRVVGGSQQDADGSVVGGGAVRWVLLNDGSVAWPAGTTLRLVGGPLLLCPIVDVPQVAPGQTVDVELEAKETEEPVEIFYSLVTEGCQPFGEIAHVKVVPKPQTPKPAVAVVASPMDGVEGGLEALQGEVKSVEWVLANVGLVPWPEDVSAKLVYNTPGFEHLPGSLELPALAPGATVHAGISALMPERQGCWKAMWVVTSPSNPEFGEILVVEFKVGDFPFMDWMLADEPKADSISDVSSQAPAVEVTAEPAKKKISASVAFQRHELPGGHVSYADESTDNEELVSLGTVSDLPRGTPWLMEIAVTIPTTALRHGPRTSSSGAASAPASVAAASQLTGQPPVQAGETVLLQLGLQAPEAPGRSAWVLASGQHCFGPAMMLQVE